MQKHALMAVSCWHAFLLVRIGETLLGLKSTYSSSFSEKLMSHVTCDCVFEATESCKHSQ